MNKETQSEKWNLKTASACIIRNGGKVSSGKFSHPQPGIKVLGAMDYLKNVHKYVSVAEKVHKKLKPKKVYSADDNAPKVIVMRKRRQKPREDF